MLTPQCKTASGGRCCQAAGIILTATISQLIPDRKKKRGALLLATAAPDASQSRRTGEDGQSGRDAKGRGKSDERKKGEKTVRTDKKAAERGDGETEREKSAETKSFSLNLL